MRSSTNISCRRSRTAVPGAWSGRSHLAFVATLIAACCVAGCDAVWCWIEPDRNGAVAIPDGTTSIPDAAFQHCLSLVSVTIPDSVTSIPDFAFGGCTSLVSVTIPDSVTSLGNYAFAGCISLASVTIPDSVTSLGDYAFNGCDSLVSVTIPDSVTSLGNYAFAGCISLVSVTIPDSVTSIPDLAFVNCGCDVDVYGDLYVAGANFLDCVTVVPPTPAPTCAAVTPETDAEALMCAAAATFPSLSGIIQAMQTKADLLAFLDGPAVTATIAAASQEAIAAADRCYQNPNGHGC